MYNIIIKQKKKAGIKMRLTVCYATMIGKDGKEFTYELEREDYTLRDFDKEFQKIAKQRGWQYVECGTTRL